MQTYTHAVVGAALGVMLFPDNYSAQTACVAASIVPDLVMVPPFLFDRLAGRNPLEHQSHKLMILKEITHSLPLWLLFAFFVWSFAMPWRTIGYALAVGGLGHIFIDIFTHGSGPKEGRKYWDVDLTFMWPLPFDLRPFGLWEYRIGTGILRPKLPELIIIFGCLVIVILVLGF